MPDSLLNAAEHVVQPVLRKSRYFNGLPMAGAVLAAFVPISALPDRPQRHSAVLPIAYAPVPLLPLGPFRVAGAWQVKVMDRRAGGLSGLAIGGGRFVSVSDLGAVVAFDPPAREKPMADIADLRDGPGNAGLKIGRDAEALARDSQGRGWWVAYEQRHSLWLYDSALARAQATVPVHRPAWWDNRGIEGLVADGDGLLAFPENGREVIRIDHHGQRSLPLQSPMDVAEAARATDGSIWLLLRSKSLKGIDQAIAPLMADSVGYRVGPLQTLPKAAFDNYEGMAFASLPGGGWRIWLLTDDGHRFMARTLLVAIDWNNPPDRRHNKRPATSAGRL
ncbi:hypothetical protein D3M59_05160 [Sphingomonas edaphi]|uniref:Phytase-like domain-containing protein n=2 Tax=Sphingomonas edaphi TaxID=2315689 RepID=A0A418Q369_9SPHN|nr:hypothetical protein D3M59_05160 [Sphingomonas edaphi]